MREGCLQRQWASVSPPTSFSTSLFSFSSRQAPAPQIGSGPPTTCAGVLYGDNRKICWRRLASTAALRHLPHIGVSPRPRELHTSHMEECTNMNINMQTTPPLQISLCHTCRVLLSRDGRLSWVTPPTPFLPLPPLLFSFLFLPLLPSNSHHRLGEARLFASLADDFLFLNVEYRYRHGNAEADGKFSSNCRTALASRSFFRRFFSVNLWGFIFQNRAPPPSRYNDPSDAKIYVGRF